MSNSFSLRFDAAGGKVLFDHERDLEGDGVVELAQIEARELLDLLETVDERISVDEQLSRRFGEDELFSKNLLIVKSVSLSSASMGFFLKTSCRNISHSVVGS